MTRKLKTHQENIEKFEYARKFWLKISFFVVVMVNGIVFSWNTAHPSGWSWLVTSLGLIVSVVWWYWTMKLVRVILNSRVDELEILKDLTKDIKSIKKDLQKFKK
jgi:hypothetical protein